MLTPDGKPITSHSTTPVPFVAALPSDSTLKFTRKEGGVADVAPSMLASKVRLSALMILELMGTLSSPKLLLTSQ